MGNLKDLLRFSITAADPMIVAMCVHGLLDLTHIKVLAINNKYLGDAQAIIDAGSPSILVNLRIDLRPLPPFIFEVQVYLDTFLSLKTSQHKTYEFTRAKRAADLLRPIFDQPEPLVVF